MDQLPRLGKRELICLLLFTCNYVVSVWRGFLFLWVLGMGYVILLWHSLSLPYTYFGSSLARFTGPINDVLLRLVMNSLLRAFRAVVSFALVLGCALSRPTGLPLRISLFRGNGTMITDCPT